MLKRKLARLFGMAALTTLPLTASCGSEPVTPHDPSLSTASALTLTLYGANNQAVPRSTNCTWSVSVSGGTPPYSFQWFGERGSGTQQSYTEQMPFTLGELAEIEVYVSDSGGQYGYASALVWAGSSSLTC